MAMSPSSSATRMCLAVTRCGIASGYSLSHSLCGSKDEVETPEDRTPGGRLLGDQEARAEDAVARVRRRGIWEVDLGGEQTRALALDLGVDVRRPTRVHRRTDGLQLEGAGGVGELVAAIAV